LCYSLYRAILDISVKGAFMASQRPNSATPAANGNEESFEKLLAKLEEIVGQLEAGEKPLEESLALYEQGIVALKRCHVILDGADKRIRKLVQNAAGEPVLHDITQAAKSASESRRTKAKGELSEHQISAQDSGQDFQAADELEEAEPENSGNPDVDAERESQHNPSSSTTSKAKTRSQSGKAGGSLFGSAQQ
jgi:exodeoxyribonuclease VII small subunit